MTKNFVDYHLPFGNKYNSPRMGVIHGMGEWIIIDKIQSQWFDEEKNLDIPAGQYHATEFLRRRGLSAHVLVSPSILIRIREDNQGAFHAGGHNTDTLGAEFLIPGIWHYNEYIALMKSNENWLTEKQFNMGLALFNGWVTKYNWPVDAVRTHHEISPERKNDPGNGFPLEEFRSGLHII